MQTNEASKQKEAMQTEYNPLIGNETQKLVKCPIDQHILTAK